jgi:O-antigen/teichoic acid export membrane protein
MVPRRGFGFELRRSPALRTAIVFGLAGAGFVAANLILARILPTLEYAVFALVITFLNVGIPLAPFGADDVINRRAVSRDGRLLKRALATSFAMAVLVAGIAGRWYGLSIDLLLVIMVATMAGGVNHVAVSHFQSRRAFHISLPLMQAVNFVMVAAALATWWLGWRNAVPAILVIASSYVVLAVAGWRLLLRAESGALEAPEPFLWTEALSCVGVTGVAILLGQLERLLIPQLLTLEALATYGVLAAIVGSTFRMLWMGVGYSLVPRLRAATEIAERNRIFRRELQTVGLVVVFASAGIWVVTPPLVEWALDGRYVLPAPLILAALVNGVLKVGSAFGRAAATALGDNHQLGRLNVLGWASVALAVAGAAFGARWGLAGVLYGVALGWLSQGVTAMWIAAPHLRASGAMPPSGPVRASHPAGTSGSGPDDSPAVREPC